MSRRTITELGRALRAREVSSRELAAVALARIEAADGELNSFISVEPAMALAAAERAGVRSPLVEAGLGKEAVRALARELGLTIWDKPASPCLASRVPYGSPVTRERLQRIEQAERALRSHGFREFRVRFHETIARLELGPEDFERLVDMDLRRRITEQIKAAGFQYACVDLVEFRSGRLNMEGFDPGLAATRNQLP